MATSILIIYVDIMCGTFFKSADRYYEKNA